MGLQVGSQRAAQCRRAALRERGLQRQPAPEDQRPQHGREARQQLQQLQPAQQALRGAPQQHGARQRQQRCSKNVAVVLF